MNARHFVPALVALALWFVSFAARADEGIVRRFASDAPVEVIRTSACAMKPTVTIEGQSRSVDVIVEGLRCDAAAAPEGALPLLVRVESGSVREIVLETGPALRASLAAIVTVLAARVAIAKALPPITEPSFPTPSAQELRPGRLGVPAILEKNGWRSVRHHKDAGRVLAIVIPSVLAGVALFVGTSFLLASSHGSGFIGGSF